MRTSKISPVLLLIALAASAPASLGASYRMPSDEAMVQKAAAVIRGRVVDIASVQDPDGAIHTDVTISVERVMKGTVGDSWIVVRQPGGTVGDRSEFYPGIGGFVPGDRVLLMLSPIKGGRFRVTDFALGNFTVLQAPDGSEFLRREGLHDAFLLGGAAGPGEAVATLPGSSLDAAPADAKTVAGDPDRDASSFERYVTAVGLGLTPPVDYILPAPQAIDDSMRIAEFVFLGSPPARWTQFDSGTTVTYMDNTTGDPGSHCQPGGCHAQVNAGVLKWNGIAGTQILLAYGGTDDTIGTKCLSALDNQIQFSPASCDDMSNLSGCSGTLALGGFSSSNASGGSPPCPAKGNPAFQKITNAKIEVNKTTGDCLNACDYTEMIAHETGHTLGAGHTDVNGALMQAILNSGLCGNPRADDAAFAQCAYPQLQMTCDLTATKTWGGPPPIGVTFSPNLTGGIGPFTYDYDFGDGTSDGSVKPTHTFTTVNTFNTNLTITDSNAQTCSDSLSVTIQPCAAPNVTTVTPKLDADGLWKIIVAGKGFKKGAAIEIDSGSGFVRATLTKFKSKKKLLAKDIDAIWPASTDVQVRAVNPDTCPSNPVLSTR